jgi:MFS family permease
MLIRLVGARRLFLVSAPGAGVALVGLGLSTSVISITIWQGVMAAFYATASIAGQEYAIRAAGEKDRAKAVGAFVAVVYGGLFVGSALGGLLAGRFGFAVAFFTGAALAVISVILGASSMRGRAGDRVEGRADGASDPAAVRVSPRSWLTGR